MEKTTPIPPINPTPVKDAIVPITDDTIAFTTPINHTKSSPPSWGRWWRQIGFIPFLHNRWLTPSAKATLTQAIAQTEVGHRGEVFLVVENTLPLNIARFHDCRERAIDLFSLYRIWDTADNTGVLVYLNVCERKLEIVADRGINNHVMPTVWQAMCDKAIEDIKADRPVEGLQNLLTDIGQLLRQYYQSSHDHKNTDPHGNEISDTIVYLR